MNRIKIKAQVLASVWMFAAVGYCSASTSLSMTNSPSNPAAQGEVKVGKADNGNTKIDVVVKHLAPVQKIDPKSNSYVVWARPAAEQTRAVNLGALTVNKNLEGELETVTPFQNFHLFITPEPTPQALDPAGQPVLWTDVNR